ncbi:MAG TPA: PaaI family thioesterase [Burkholderiales bacterium]|nr:PaaI family thioesterase [Burkholderiales bacterium]
MTDVPEGFHPVQRIQPHTFAGLAGPFYAKRDGREVSLGLRVEARHLNNRGTCHGGFLATLADIALGYACVAAGEAQEQGRNFVTIDLAVQYLAGARLGDWLQSEVRVLNAGTRTASAEGHLLANGVPVARISANFRVAKARPADPAGS